MGVVIWIGAGFGFTGGVSGGGVFFFGIGTIIKGNKFFSNGISKSKSSIQDPLSSFFFAIYIIPVTIRIIGCRK